MISEDVKLSVLGLAIWLSSLFPIFSTTVNFADKTGKDF